MKNKLFMVSLLTMSVSAIAQNTYFNKSGEALTPKAQKETPTNQFGLPIFDRAGQKITYSKEELVGLTPLKTQEDKGNAIYSSSPLKPRMNKSMMLDGQSFTLVNENLSYGVGIGLLGMDKLDIEKDGVYEIVLGSNNGWSIQKYNESTESYELIHRVQNAQSYSDQLKRLRVVEDQLGNNYIVTITRSGDLSIFNGLTFDLLRSEDVLMNNVEDFYAGDANNDGNLDLTVTASSQTKIINFETLSTLITINDGASAVRVGQTNSDALQELVLSSGVVYQVSEGTPTELWRYSGAFGYWIELGNTDDDNELEIIGLDSWNALRAADVSTESIVWEVSTSDNDSLRLQDINGDDVPEIILGEGQWGDVKIYDIKTQENLLNIDNPEHGVTNTLVIDGDNDGNLELYWGAGHTSSGADYLYAYDLSTNTREWQSSDYSGPFTGVAAGDLDNDGSMELVYASFESNSGYDDGLLFILDAKTFAVKHITAPNFFNGNAWTGVHDVAIANVDDDPQNEIIVTTDRLYDGMLYIIDGISYEKELQIELDDGSPLYAMEVFDIDGDGVKEIITGAGKEHTGSPGTYVYAINGDDGSLVWQSPSISTSWSDTQDVHIADIDDNGSNDVLVVLDNINVINSDTGAIENVFTGNYLSVVTLQLDDDNALEILAGTNTGSIAIIDGATGTIESTIASLCSGPVRSLKALSSDIILGNCGEMLFTYDLNLGAVDWSELTGDNLLGSINNIETYLIDGKLQFSIGGSQSVKTYLDTSSNIAPQVLEMSFSTHWRSLLSETLVATDENEEDSLTYQLVSNGSLGRVLSLNAETGTFEYQAQPTIGTDTFTYRASDGLVNSNDASVTIEILNTTPYGDDMIFDLHWRAAQQFTLLATDDDNDPLTYQLVDNLSRGHVELQSATDGSVLITAPRDSLESENFTFKISDSVSESESVTVIVNYTNTTPVATGRTYHSNGSDIISGRVLAVDDNNDPLTFAVITQPQNGTLVFDEDTGVFDYTPSNTQAESSADEFEFVANDGVSTSEKATITINYSSNNNDSDDDGSGSFSFIMLLALVTFGAFRRRKSC